MPADTKITPPLLRKLLRLHEGGASIREMATELNLGRSTVGRWLAERGLKPNGTNRGGGKATAKVKPSGAPAMRPEDVAREVAKAEAEIDLPGSSRALLRKRLAVIRASLEANHEAFVAGSFSGSVYERLSDLEMKYARELATLEPPPENNPDKDPANVEAGEKLTVKLEALVAREEKGLRCCHCGAHPYR